MTTAAIRVKNPTHRPLRHILMAALAAYLFAYGAYRHSHTEIWDRDGMAYVMFAENSTATFRLFFPVLLLDQIATGARYQIGAHPTPAPADTGVYMRLN